jgi:hypothetical protein
VDGGVWAPRKRADNAAIYDRNAFDDAAWRILMPIDADDLITAADTLTQATPREQ